MSGAKVSILIVEDDEATRNALARIFTGMGHRVRSAPDGLNALAEICREEPTVLLTDLYMPRMSGFELLSVVSRSFPAIRLVAMSGKFSGSHVPGGVVADAFYEKGSGMVDLLMAVLVTSRQPRDESQSTREEDEPDRTGTGS